MLHALKNRLVPVGTAPHRVSLGPCAGIRFNLDLHSQMGRYLGLYEREVASHLWRAARNVRTAIDVGAADGWYTLYFLQKTQAETVYAFEPQWADSLAPNLAVNHFDRSRLVLSTAWVSDTAASVAQWTESATPPWTTLDAVGEVHSPCVIKVDVDGGELDVLRGARSLCRPGRVRWIIETHSLELERQCIDQLRRYGYEPVIIPNAWWRTISGEQRPLAHNRWLVAH